MASEKRLNLISPFGGEQATYTWPLTHCGNDYSSKSSSKNSSSSSNSKVDGSLEIIETIRWVFEDVPELRDAMREELSVFTISGDMKSYESMKSLCDKYNSSLSEILETRKVRLIPGNRPSRGLLKHIIQKSYNQAVSDPDKLNEYKSWSPEVYGETSFDFINQMLDAMSLTSEDIFIDLGSGVGQVVLQVAASVNVSRCIGIEKSHVPVNYSKDLDKWYKFWMNWFGKSFTPYELIKGDFFDEKFRSLISSASFIFVNNFAFGPRVDHSLKKRFEDLKDGTRIVSSKPFSPLNFRISDRNLNDIGTMMDVRELQPVQESVSWTYNSVSYYCHTINRKKLEVYFNHLKHSRSKIQENEASSRKISHFNSFSSNSSSASNSSATTCISSTCITNSQHLKNQKTIKNNLNHPLNIERDQIIDSIRESNKTTTTISSAADSNSPLSVNSPSDSSSSSSNDSSTSTSNNHLLNTKSTASENNVNFKTSNVNYNSNNVNYNSSNVIRNTSNVTCNTDTNTMTKDTSSTSMTSCGGKGASGGKSPGSSSLSGKKAPTTYDDNGEIIFGPTTRKAWAEFVKSTATTTSCGNVSSGNETCSRTGSKNMKTRTKKVTGKKTAPKKPSSSSKSKSIEPKTNKKSIKNVSTSKDEDDDEDESSSSSSESESSSDDDSSEDESSSENSSSGEETDASASSKKKENKKTKDGDDEDKDDDDDEEDEDIENKRTTNNVPKVATSKPGRGRPRKYPPGTVATKKPAASIKAAKVSKSGDIVPKIRGRPPKSPRNGTSTCATGSKADGSSLDIFHNSTLATIQSSMAKRTSPAPGTFEDKLDTSLNSPSNLSHLPSAIIRDSTLLSVEEQLDNLLHSIRGNMLAFLSHMQMPEFRLKISKEIELEKKKNQSLKLKEAALEQSIKSLQASGLELLKSKLDNLGFGNVTSPQELLTKAAELMTKTKQLQEQELSLTAQVKHAEVINAQIESLLQQSINNSSNSKSNKKGSKSNSDNSITGSKIGSKNGSKRTSTSSNCSSNSSSSFDPSSQSTKNESMGNIDKVTSSPFFGNWSRPSGTPSPVTFGVKSGQDVSPKSSPFGKNQPPPPNSYSSSRSSKSSESNISNANDGINSLILASLTQQQRSNQGVAAANQIQGGSQSANERKPATTITSVTVKETAAKVKKEPKKRGPKGRDSKNHLVPKDKLSEVLNLPPLVKPEGLPPKVPILSKTRKAAAAAAAAQAANYNPNSSNLLGGNNNLMNDNCSTTATIESVVANSSAMASHMSPARANLSGAPSSSLAPENKQLTKLLLKDEKHVSPKHHSESSPRLLPGSNKSSPRGGNETPNHSGDNSGNENTVKERLTLTLVLDRKNDSASVKSLSKNTSPEKSPIKSPPDYYHPSPENVETIRTSKRRSGVICSPERSNLPLNKKTRSSSSKSNLVIDEMNDSQSPASSTTSSTGEKKITIKFGSSSSRTETSHLITTGDQASSLSSQSTNDLHHHHSSSFDSNSDKGSHLAANSNNLPINGMIATNATSGSSGSTSASTWTHGGRGSSGYRKWKKEMDNSFDKSSLISNDSQSSSNSFSATNSNNPPSSNLSTSHVGHAQNTINNSDGHSTTSSTRPNSGSSIESLMSLDSNPVSESILDSATSNTSLVNVNKFINYANVDEMRRQQHFNPNRNQPPPPTMYGSADSESMYSSMKESMIQQQQYFNAVAASSRSSSATPSSSSGSGSSSSSNSRVPPNPYPWSGMWPGAAANQGAGSVPYIRGVPMFPWKG